MKSVQSAYRKYGITKNIVAKSLFKKIRKHKTIIIVIIVVLFILLVILGYTMNPDKTWRSTSREQETRTQ
jgi:Na+/H+ antiporter NhaC